MIVNYLLGESLGRSVDPLPSAPVTQTRTDSAQQLWMIILRVPGGKSHIDRLFGPKTGSRLVIFEQDLTHHFCLDQSL